MQHHIVPYDTIHYLRGLLQNHKNYSCTFNIYAIKLNFHTNGCLKKGRIGFVPK